MLVYDNLNITMFIYLPYFICFGIYFIPPIVYIFISPN
jgi:hypothetical protein